VIRCQNGMAMKGGSGLGGMVNVKGFWNGPKFSQVLRVFQEQGLIFVGLLGLSTFFSMAETSITTLSPWKKISSFDCLDRSAYLKVKQVGSE
ncbi:hypothetical protein Tco_0557380, partial [Tanacetum coccineum]